MNLPGANDRHQSQVLYESRLQERFLSKINRLVFRYGKAQGKSSMTLRRDGLTVIHNDEMLIVELDDCPLVRYVKPDKMTGLLRPEWASDRKLRDAMKQLDTMFVLDDLAGL